jgi:hypothetical protein
MAGIRSLIKRHVKGVPPQLGYSAWRLTARGVGAVLDAFPSEPIQEGFDDRLAGLSLVDIDHREAITRLYLDLICGDRSELTEAPSWQAVQQWIAAVHDRASRFSWQPDGAVVLRYRDLGDDYRIVPDATITSTRKRVRFYLELDRSNKGLSRIKENLKCYDTFTRELDAKVFQDGKVPWVIYVVPSTARRDSVAKLARETLRCRWKVAIAGHAAQWLAAQLLDEQRADPSAPSELDTMIAANAELSRSRSVVLQAADELFRSCADLSYRNPNAFRELGQVDPTVYARWQERMTTVQRLVQEVKRAG